VNIPLNAAADHHGPRLNIRLYLSGGAHDNLARPQDATREMAIQAGPAFQAQFAFQPAIITQDDIQAAFRVNSSFFA
jgi:hypothetical protein